MFDLDYSTFEILSNNLLYKIIEKYPQYQSKFSKGELEELVECRQILNNSLFFFGIPIENKSKEEIIEIEENKKIIKKHYIYFIRESDRERVKIGLSENPKKRIKALQTSSPTKLDLLKVIEGDETKEYYLHNKFKDYHIKGEWFLLSHELLNYIKTLGD